MVEMDVRGEREQRLAGIGGDRVRKPGQPHAGIDDEVAVAAAADGTCWRGRSRARTARRRPSGASVSCAPAEPVHCSCIVVPSADCRRSDLPFSLFQPCSQKIAGRDRRFCPEYACPTLPEITPRISAGLPRRAGCSDRHRRRGAFGLFADAGDARRSSSTISPPARSRRARSISIDSGVTSSDVMYASFADEGFVLPAIPYQKVHKEFRRQIVVDPTGEQPGTIVVKLERALPLLRAARRRGAALRRRHRPRRLPLVGPRQHPVRQEMADLDAAVRDDRPQAGAGEMAPRPAGRPRQSARRARDVHLQGRRRTPATACTARRNGGPSARRCRRAACA